MKNIFLNFALISCLLTTACEYDEVKVVRIGTLGDSITRGIAGANVPDELDNLLPDNYEVVNYAVAGTCLVKNSFSPIWNTDRFAQLQIDAPDIITIMLGTNDANPTNSDTVRANYDRDYREMIELFQGLPSHPRILLCYPPPVYENWILIDSVIRTEIIPIIDNIAKDYQLEIADTYYLVNDYPEHYPDKLHPDKAGSKTLAKIIADALDL